jgi:hypothetical protein
MSVEKLINFEDSFRKRPILSHEMPFFCSQNYVQRTKYIFEKTNTFTKNIISVEAAKVLLHVKEFLAT